MSAVTVCQSPLRVTLRPQALAIDLFGHDIVVADHGEHRAVDGRGDPGPVQLDLGQFQGGGAAAAFGLGLFGLEKCRNIGRTVSQLRDALDRIQG